LYKNEFPIVISNWDNTPRSGKNGLVLEHSSPEVFRKHLKKAINLLDDRSFDESIIFVKSWNEWAEGNYLEPGLEFGYDFLNVIKEEVFI
jgi:hypothetical protein